MCVLCVCVCVCVGVCVFVCGCGCECVLYVLCVLCGWYVGGGRKGAMNEGAQV